MNYINAFIETHDIKFVTGSLSENELALAKDLQLEKYGSDTWTARL